MDIFQNLTNVINYIEDHLKEEINVKEISKLAHCSEQHLRRMFPYLTGITISQYIRKRRLSAAALELYSSIIPIVDIALKYNYDSRISFSRAFKEFHGISPSEARKTGTIMELYPRLVFKLISNGGITMKYRLENLKEFKLFGVARKIEMHENKHEVLPIYAEEVMKNGTHDMTNDIIGHERGSSLHGIHYYGTHDASYYMFGWEYQNHYNITDQMNVIDVKAGKWVVFQGSISYEQQNEFHQTWKEIYSNWFPNSNFQQGGNPCIEKFFHDHFEIWIPIEDKSNLS